MTKRFFSEGEQIAGTAYLFSKDHLGSIRQMTDLGGTVRASYSYDPYGRRTKLGGDLDTDLGYTGHYYHSPSALYLTLYRAYDSDKGRWISRDPLDDAEMLQGPNLYNYVSNNPVNLRDALGLFIENTGWNWDPNNLFGGGSPKNPEQLKQEGRDGLTACAVAGGIYAAPAVAAAYRVPSTLYHFTSNAAASSIGQTGIRAAAGIFGTGVYGSSVRSNLAAKLMGAASTETSVPFLLAG